MHPEWEEAGAASPAGDGRAWPPYRKGDNLPGAGALAMRLFILSLAVPFVVCVIVYFSMRAASSVWPPAGAPRVPSILWLSTVLIAATSLGVHTGMRAVRDERQERLRDAMLATLFFGSAFLVCQFIAAVQVLEALSALRAGPEAALSNDLGLFAAAFFVLVVLHAIHVLGGIVLQIVVTVRAHRGRYRYYHHPGVRYAAMYWHFLDAAWLLVFLTLIAGTAARG